MRGVIQHDNLNRRLMCTHEITKTKLFSNWFQLDFRCDLLRPATSPPERSEWGRSGGQWGRIPHTHILTYLDLSQARRTQVNQVINPCAISHSYACTHLTISHSVPLFSNDVTSNLSLA